jgi:hypothetical protein
VPPNGTAKLTPPPPPPPYVSLSLNLKHGLGVGSLEGCQRCSGGGGDDGRGGSGENAGTRVVVVAAARMLERVWWWWCSWWWWWQPLLSVVQRCDGDAPGRPPSTARRRRQRPPGRTTAATAATPSLLGAQVWPHRRPNLLREHQLVLHLLTEASFAGPGEEACYADDLARPSPTTTVTAANAASTMDAVTRRQRPRIKSRWRCKSCWQGS